VRTGLPIGLLLIVVDVLHCGEGADFANYPGKQPTVVGCC